jgi:DNA-binding CsgD family transcriptional regulator
MIDLRLVTAVADEFAAAALDGARWLGALRAMADATGSQHGQLIGIGGPRTIPFNWVSDLDEKPIRDFVTISGGSPLINPRVHAGLQTDVLEIAHEAHYEAAQPYLTSDVYLDYSREHDIPFGCQTKISEDENGLIGLAVLRSSADGPTTDRDRATFAAIMPHARSAVRIHAALEKDAPFLLAGALERMGSAAFICDAHGHIRAMTPAADHHLQLGWLRNAAGTLTASHPADAVAIAAAFAAACAAPRTAGPVSIALTGDHRPQILDIVTLPHLPWTLSFRPRLLVLVRRGDTQAGASSLLQRAYALTGAEADIAVRLALGEARAAIADARAVSLDTVRSQIKAVFAKLGVARETELAALIAPLLHGGMR